MKRDGYETAAESPGSNVNSSNGKLPDTSQADGLRNIPFVVYQPKRRKNEQLAKASADRCYSSDDDTDTDSMARDEGNRRKKLSSRREQYYEKYEARKGLRSVDSESEAESRSMLNNSHVEEEHSKVQGPLSHINRKTDRSNNSSGLGTGRLKTRSSGNGADTSSKSNATIPLCSGGLGPGGQSDHRPRGSASRATGSGDGEKRLPGVPRHYGKHEIFCGDDIPVRVPETDSEFTNGGKTQARRGLESRRKLKAESRDYSSSITSVSSIAEPQQVKRMPLRRFKGEAIKNVGKEKKVTIESKLNTNLHTMMYYI